MSILPTTAEYLLSKMFVKRDSLEISGRKSEPRCVKRLAELVNKMTVDIKMLAR